MSAQCGRTVMAEGKGEAVDGRTGQIFGGAEGETLLKCTKSLIYVYARAAGKIYLDWSIQHMYERWSNKARNLNNILS